MNKDQEKRFREVFDQIAKENPHMNEKIVAEHAYNRFKALDAAFKTKTREIKASEMMEGGEGGEGGQ